MGAGLIICACGEVGGTGEGVFGVVTLVVI